MVIYRSDNVLERRIGPGHNRPGQQHTKNKESVMAKAKFGQNRNGEIALAWIIWKYSTRGVDCDPKKIPKWLERRSRQTNLSEVSLYLFLQKVIVPAIFHQKMEWKDDSVIAHEFQGWATMLASYELYRDENELEDQALSFQ